MVGRAACPCVSLAVVAGKVDGDGHCWEGLPAHWTIVRRAFLAFRERLSRLYCIDAIPLRETVKQPKSAIPAKRASKGPRGERMRPQPRQYTVADLERARDQVEAAERRIDNDHTSNPDRGRAGLEQAQLELHAIELQLRLRGLLE